MENRDEFSKRLFFQWLRDQMVPSGQISQRRSDLAFLALLAFVGEEAVQIIFRKNFGKGGLDPIRIIVCFLLFEIIAVAFFLTGLFADDSLEVIGSRLSFFLASGFYAVLGFIILLKGIRGIKEAKEDYLLSGESAFLSFLTKDGWSHSKIQNIAEPVLTLAIGVFFLLINIPWGIPIIYCALSVWACKVIDSIFLIPPSNPNSNRQQNGGDTADFN